MNPETPKETFEELLEQYTSSKDVKAAMRDKVDEEVSETTKPKRRLRLKKVLSQMGSDDIQNIDLHGHSRNTAEAMVNQLISACKRSGDDYGLIITGRGNRSENGAILRPKVREQLEQLKSKGDIMDFKSAPPNLGGSGAFVVILK